MAERSNKEILDGVLKVHVDIKKKLACWKTYTSQELLDIIWEMNVAWTIERLLDQLKLIEFNKSQHNWNFLTYSDERLVWNNKDFWLFKIQEGIKNNRDSIEVYLKNLQWLIDFDLESMNLLQDSFSN